MWKNESWALKGNIRLKINGFIILIRSKVNKLITHSTKHNNYILKIPTQRYKTETRNLGETYFQREKKSQKSNHVKPI